MKLKIFAVLSLIFMVVMNAIAIVSPFNGISTWELSNSLNTFITPAGFTFSIWSVIYIWLIAVTLRYAIGKITLPREAVLIYIATCILNGLWILAWHYGNLHLSLLIILAIMIWLIVIDRDIRDNVPKRVRSIFLMYFGWIQIATLLMTLIYFQYQLDLFTDPMLYKYICAWILAAAWLLNLLVIYKERNIMTSLVAIWAMWGIINNQFDPMIIKTAWVVIAALWLGTVLGLARKYFYRPRILD